MSKLKAAAAAAHLVRQVCQEHILRTRLCSTRCRHSGCSWPPCADAFCRGAAKAWYKRQCIGVEPEPGRLAPAPQNHTIHSTLISLIKRLRLSGVTSQLSVVNTVLCVQVIGSQPSTHVDVPGGHPPVVVALFRCLRRPSRGTRVRVGPRRWQSASGRGGDTDLACVC